MADNASVQVRRIDKSLVPQDAVPNGLTLGCAIHAERGFINLPYFISGGPAGREAVFGKKNARKYGISAHSLDLYLKSGNPAYVVRAGDTTWRNAGLKLQLAHVIKEAWVNGNTYVVDDVVTYNDVAWKAVTGIALNDVPGVSVHWVKEVLTGTAGALQRSDIDGSFTALRGILNISALGEGVWGNDLKVTGTAVTQTYDATGELNQRLTDITVTYKGNVVEVWRVSSKPGDTDPSGASFYIEDVINGNSKYIAVGHSVNNPSAGLLQDVESIAFLFVETALVGGIDTKWATVPAREAGFKTALESILSYPETYELNFAMNAGAELAFADFASVVDANGTVFGAAGIRLSDFPTTAAGIGTIGADLRAATKPYNGSYWNVSLDGPSILVTEEETGVDVLVTTEGARLYDYGVAAINGQVFFPIAGYRRGVIQGAKGVSTVLTPDQRGLVADAQINPIRTDKFGTVLGDELTTQTFKSGYSDIHTAVAFLAMKKVIKDFGRGFLFEFNDIDTVTDFENGLDAILSQLALPSVKAIQPGYTIDHTSNVFGSDTIRIRVKFQPYGTARDIVVDAEAYPSTGTIKV